MTSIRNQKKNAQSAISDHDLLIYVCPIASALRMLACRGRQHVFALMPGHDAVFCLLSRKIIYFSSCMKKTLRLNGERIILFGKTLQKNEWCQDWRKYKRKDGCKYHGKTCGSAFFTSELQCLRRSGAMCPHT